MSTGTDPVALSRAAEEAVAALTSSLGTDLRAGEAFDLWGQPPAEAQDLLAAGAAWSAPLIGPVGTCGEIALALASGSAALGESEAGTALAACAGPLGVACGCDHTGPAQRCEPISLLGARPGQRATAFPLLGTDGWEGLVVVFTSPAAAELPHLDPVAGAGLQRSIASLSEVEMTVSVELGRTKIPIKDLLNLHNGSVVQLDRPVTQPVDIFVQGTLIARGEVVVVDECFAVRVTELLTGE